METSIFEKRQIILFAVFLLAFLSCKKEEDEKINLGLVKVEANSAEGFNWPYYLNVPNSSKSATLLVIPNNTGTVTDDQAVHDNSAKQTAEWGAEFAKVLNIPVLVPTFPRANYIGWTVYTHALDRETMQITTGNMQRIDIQLIAMIDDAIERLSVEGVELEFKVFILGFSASGMFANRFTVLHPDRIRAAAIGSPGGWPIVPISSWEGQTLRYHIGVSDIQQLTGSPFNLNLFKEIPLLFFIGDQDTNDSVPYDDSYEQVDRNLVNTLFGTTPVQRWPKAEQIYTSAGCFSQFKTYSGAGHQITDAMMEDITEFFREKQ
jgi:predicted esterase